ncbi:MAG: Hsp20/alpha crystallin family protein [Anaerolineales bacterium]|nr:Hsp20/alpha crystallin family protein [Anaerolineales bacterium]
MTIYISPRRRMAYLREAMTNLVDESLEEGPNNEREMMLAVDVCAEEEAYTIKALVPGLEADDINIEILNNTIALRGEFESTDIENVKYLNCELPSGKFRRVITLPTELDSAKSEANIKNGVLVLRVPKAEVDRPKTIKINVSEE